MSALATKRIAILISGRGSNMVALADAVQDGTIANAEVAIVISDKRGATGLERAGERGIETLVIERGGRTRAEHDREIVAGVGGRPNGLGFFARGMGGFLSGFFVAYLGRILTIHPSLLPGFS